MMLFRLLTITHEQRSNLRIVARRINGDGTAGKKYIITVTGFKPYFYVPRDETVNPRSDILRVETGYKSFTGKPLKKVVVSTPSVVKELREQFTEAYEADIPYPRRFLIDKNIFGYFKVDGTKFDRIIDEKDIVAVDPQELAPHAIPPPSVCFIDIEVFTKSKKRMPEPTNEENKIIAISILDSRFDGECHTMLLKPPYHDDNNKIELGKNVIVYEDERKLIQDFIKFLGDPSISPDVISGWNIDFDLGYILERCRFLDIPVDFMREKGHHYFIEGVMVLDLLATYRQLKGKNYGNRLKDVVVREGFVQAEELVSSEYRNELYTNPKLITDLIAYNQDDVKFCKLIDDKYQLITTYYKRMVDWGIEDLSISLNRTPGIDSIALRIAKKESVVLPSVNRKQKGSRYRGAIVLPVMEGIHRHVAQFDFSRFYPSVIMAFNLSPELKNIVEDKKRVALDLGIAGKICQYFWKLRDYWEEKLKQCEKGTNEYESIKLSRLSAKYSLNAVYGYLGFERSRLYDIEVASRVTAECRNFIQHVKQHVENVDEFCNFLETTGASTIIATRDEIRDLKSQGFFTVIYGDTDSIYITLPRNLVPVFEQYINYGIKKRSEQLGIRPLLEMKFEDYSQSMLFIKKKGSNQGAKKKYAKLLEDESIDIKGFESKKQDQALITQRLQKMAIEFVLKDKKEELIATLKEVVKQFKQGKIDVDDIALRVAIGKDIEQYKTNTPQVRAIQFSNKYLGLDLGKGDNIKYVYIKGFNGNSRFPKTDVVAFLDKETLPKDMEIDYLTMLDKTVRKKVEPILEVVGIDWEGDIMGVNKLTKYL